MVLEHLKYNDQLIRMNVAERLIIDFVGDNSHKEQLVVIVPNDNFLFPLALELFHLDYSVGYKNRMDFGRRASVLIMTDKLSTMTLFFKKLHISVRYIIDTSIGKQQFFSGKRNNNMNDYYNTQSYWKDRLLYRYKNKLPEEVPYIYTFPVSIGNRGFTAISRAHFAKVDNVQQSCFYLTSNYNIFDLPNLPTFDYILVDCVGIKRFVKVKSNGSKVIYIFNSFLDARLLYYNKVNFCAIDTDLLEQVSLKVINNEISREFSVPIPVMKEILKIERLSFQQITTPFDKELELLTERIQKISSLKEHTQEMRLIRILYSNIVSMPVNAVEYDTIAYKETFVDSNMDLLNELKLIPDLYENIDIARCVELLQEVFRKLDNESPKQRLIINYVERALRNGNNLLIVTPHKTINKVLRLNLAENFNIEVSELEERGLYILTAKKAQTYLTSEYDVETVLFISCSNPSVLSILKKIKYRKAVALMYSSEAAIFKSFLEKINKFAKGDSTEAFSRNLAENDMKYEIGYYDRLLRKLKNVNISDEFNFDFDLDELLESKRSTKIHASIVPTSFYSVQANLVVFEDMSKCFFGLESVVKVLISDQRYIMDIPVMNLSVGDKVLFIDEKINEDLYLAILKKFKNNANYLYNMLLVEKWQEKLEDACLSKEINHLKLFSKLKEKGWKKVSPETVRNWLEKRYLGPDDPLDIKLVGEVLNIKFFMENYVEIFQSMERIRTLHRTLPRILNQAIFASHSATEKLENSVFNTFGLTILDLKNALEMREVTFIEKEKTYFVKKNDIGNIFY
ncbi:hypothetical protein C8Z91_33020 [Paenibacillus elgii]|uniref:DISARM protein DrmE C-terminal domain-containing protein n=1 Tax=Paenibacillus elgii TaxID=189691 RepID=A0A2T6FS15_9BACL|nr:DISARM system-associated protein DrmE [Paenibacillus elgii]PUA34704.1 hypothetical protein C8Z91_33020 [Paenibacillus elgii]